MEHQNALNSDNAGIILGGLAQGISKGIEEEQALMKQRRQQEQVAKTIGKLGVDNKSKITTTMKIGDSDIKIESGGDVGINKPNKGVFIVNPVTSILSKAGEVPAGSEVFTQPLSPEAIAAREEARNVPKRQYEAQKRLDTYVADANQALVAIDKIVRLTNELPKYERGFWKQTGAKADVMFKKYSADKDMVRYLGAVSQELIPIARKIMEEKGPIADSDVKRVEEGLGNPSLPTEDKIFLLEELRNKILKAIKIKQQEAEQVGSAFADFDKESEEDPVMAGLMKKYPGRTKEEIIRAMQKRKQ